MKVDENNIVSMTGRMMTELTYSHETKGEKFMSTVICIERESGVCDFLPAVVSSRLLCGYYGKTDDYITIDGQLRTYNKNKTVNLAIFAKECFIWDNAEYNDNFVSLKGTICRTTVKRTTPCYREIAEVLVAVNRSYNKSDYIPCVVWGRNARYINNLPVGTKIEVEGRLQSRDYPKKTDDGARYIKTTYEVSVSVIRERD